MTLPIRLDADVTKFRLFSVRREDPAFEQYQKKVFERDQHTCQYCAFQAQSDLLVLNKNGNYHQNALSNLVTSCFFCAQCFFLQAVGTGDFGGGVLLYLPEISQNQLSALTHVLFSFLLSGGEQYDEAKNIYRALRLRSQLVEQHLGEGMSQPALYGQLMVDVLESHHGTKTSAWQEGLRLLPQVSSFLLQIKQWHQDALTPMD